MLNKKCIGFILAFFLLISQSGMAITVHYCGGEVESVKTTFPISEKKGCCGKPEKKPAHCCKDEVVKADKETISIVKTISLSFECCSFSDFDFSPKNQSVFVPVKVQEIYAQANPINGPPLYLLFSQYIYYA